MKAVVTCKMRFRAEPSTEADVIRILEPGDTIILKEEEGGVWWKCTYKHKTGYVLGAYIRQEEEKMDRLEQLNNIFSKLSEDQKELNEPLKEKAIFLEAQLADLEKYPFYKVNPANPMQQKRTEAGKIYKELLQAYCNVMKMLNSVVIKSTVEESDEFDLWETNS